VSDHPEPRHKLTIKIGDALRTIQGYTMEEFKLARAEAYDDLAEDLDLIAKAKAVGASATVVNTSVPASTPAPATPSFAPPAVTPSFTSTSSPQCQHGPRTARSGTSAKGPWKAWMCPTPKGTPDQCEAIWVKRGTPEWNAFPV